MIWKHTSGKFEKRLFNKFIAIIRLMKTIEMKSSTDLFQLLTRKVSAFASLLKLQTANFRTFDQTNSIILNNQCSTTSYQIHFSFEVKRISFEVKLQ